VSISEKYVPYKPGHFKTQTLLTPTSGSVIGCLTSTGQDGEALATLKDRLES